MGAFNTGPLTVRFGPPEDVALFLRDSLDIHSFVETGTHLGGTARWAATRFKQVITVELAPEMHRQAVEVSKEHANIQFLLGDSLSCLPSACQLVDASPMFWLDAHWCGGDTLGIGAPCPLLDEIQIVNKLRPDAVILIDDARLFTCPNREPIDYPDLNSVISMLHTVDRFTVLLEDVFVSVPISKRSAFETFLKQRTYQRTASPFANYPLRKLLFELVARIRDAVLPRKLQRARQSGA